MVGGDWSPGLSEALFTAFIAAAVVGGEAYIARYDGGGGGDNDDGIVAGVACWFGPGQAFLKR